MNKDIRIERVTKIRISPSHYSEAIRFSIHPLIYAESFYLDALTPWWSMLMWGDYDAVMPLPYGRSARHMWRMRIMQPLFCQQLGIFSKNVVSEELFDAFFNQLMSLRPDSYAFHSGLTPVIEKGDYPGMRRRPNYVLNLKKDYDEIFDGYSKNTKRNIAKARKQAYEMTKNITVEEFMRLVKKTKPFKTTLKMRRTMERIIRVGMRNGKGILYGIKEKGELHAAMYILKEHGRLIHLISAADDTAKRSGMMAYMFDALIRAYAGEFMVLDFEGSELEGVARFYRGFGAVDEPYYVYERGR